MHQSLIRLLILTIIVLFPLGAVTAQQEVSCIPIEIGDTVQGTIDNENPFIIYCFTGTSDQNIIINMNANRDDLDPFLVLLDSEGEIITSNDDANGSLNSQIITILPSNQVYVIAATRHEINEGTTTGDFELSIQLDTDAGTPDNTDQDSSSTVEIRNEALRLNNLGLEAKAQGRYDDALDYYQEALNLMREINERQGEGAILNNIGVVYDIQGQYGEALDFYQQALAISREVGDRAGEGMILNNIGGGYQSQGQYGEALDFYQQALAIRREVGDRAGEGTTLNNIGGGYQSQGQYGEALDFYQQALAIHREVGNRAGEGTTLHNIGAVYLAQWQYDEALDYLEQALAIRREVGDRSGEGVTLTGIGLTYEEQGQYGEALDFYQQALAINREVGDRSGEGTALNNIGRVYEAQGQYGEALDFYQQALAINREVGDRAGEGTTLNNIGVVYDNQGQYGEALDFYQQALAINREVGDRAGDGATLNNIGRVYEAQGQYGKALDFYQQALAIHREVGDRAGEGTTLNNIGAVYRSQGQYGEALDFYQQALAINREVGDRAGEGTTLTNIGAVYDNQGQYGEALDFYQQALAISREVGDRSGEGTVLNNIGVVYQSQGQYGEALDYLEQALVIVREVGDRAGEGATLNNIGAVYENQGQYGEALDFYQQALAIRREVGDRAGEGTTLNNIGLVYDNQGEYGEALDFYQQALAISREVGDRAGEGATLNNIGFVYDNQGQYGEALNFYQQALAIQREVGRRAGEGTTLSNIGVVYRNQGQYGEALDFYQQALAINREVGDRAGEGGTLAKIGVLYDFELNDNEQAIAHYTQAVEVQERILQTTGLDEGISSLAGGNVNLYARLTTVLIEQNDLATALEYAERGRGILARDELRNSPIDFRANLSDLSLLDREQELRLAVISAQNRVNALNQDLSATNQDKQQSQADLNAAQNAYDRHIQTMQLQGGFLARELALDVASLDEIQAFLDEDTTLLLYGVSEIGSYALLVTDDDLQGFMLDATTEQIEEAVRAFAADRRANAGALSTLYDLIFAPIADEITTSDLIISPDGALNYVPFAALQAPDGSYLIDDYIISMTPSGTALVLLADREEDGVATSEGLALAQSSAPSLPTLQNANSEAQAIAMILGGEVITDATEAALRDNVAGNAVVHISAHAELNPFAPLFSTIHLAEGSEHDGRLEVREIYELDLSKGTDLVILSGCETGSGGTGEDFGLLNRAFLATGAETVVSSLWTVDDAATAELLTAFIEARESGLGEAAALREAMFQARDAYPNPYFWAPFALTGNP